MAITEVELPQDPVQALRDTLPPKVLFDPEDVELISKYHWYIDEISGYVSASTPQGRILLHRYLLGLEKYDGIHTDHINMNVLDNRRSNLRIVTRSGNGANRMKPVGLNLTSRFKGVHWDAPKRKWRAMIKVDGKKIHLGRFIDEEDAAKAYDVAAKKYFGEFARPNFSS